MYPYRDYDEFSLADKDENECKSEFRFQKNHVPLLAEVLGIPAFFKCPMVRCAVV